jgi:hypothetical protein
MSDILATYVSFPAFRELIQRGLSSDMGVTLPFNQIPPSQGRDPKFRCPGEERPELPLVWLQVCIASTGFSSIGAAPAVHF